MTHRVRPGKRQLHRSPISHGEGRFASPAVPFTGSRLCLVPSVCALTLSIKLTSRADSGEAGLYSGGVRITDALGWKLAAYSSTLQQSLRDV